MARIVALTGATGFIGSVLRQRLLHLGVHVRALSRHSDGSEDATEWVHGGLGDIDALDELVAGADAVIHCAGAVRGASSDEFNQINTEGSVRLIESARNAGTCERFLLMSTLAARYPGLSWYASSKYAAEQQVRSAAGDVAVTIFRPTAVYGPGDREMRPLFEWLLRGWLFTLGESESRLSFIHVEDLANAVLKWLVAPEAPSGTYELNDCQQGGYDWSSIAAIAAEIRNGPVHQLSIPTPLLRGVAWFNLYFSRLFHRAPMLTPAKVRELTHSDWSCSNGPIQKALGWEPQILLSRALQERWF